MWLAYFKDGTFTSSKVIKFWDDGNKSDVLKFNGPKDFDLQRTKMQALKSHREYLSVLKGRKNTWKTDKWREGWASREDTVQLVCLRPVYFE